MTDTMNGHKTLVVIQNGVPQPVAGKEKGTIFNDRDSLFTVPGEDKSEGLVYEGRTPNIHQLREMLERDGRARSLEQCLVMPMAGSDWHLKDGDHEIIEWVDNALRRTKLDGGMSTPMSDIIAQKAEAFVFKVSFHERVWTTTADNKWTYEKIAWRPPETCNLRRDKKKGTLEGFAQQIQGEIQRAMIDYPLYAD